MLPPVAEALSLIDLNQDWLTSNPTAFRRAVQILVDHVQYQSVQLSRCEDILSAYGNPTQQGGTVWSKLAAKADLSRLEKLEAQLDATLAELTTVKARTGEAAHRHDDVSGRLHALKDQVSALESKLGVPSGASGVWAGAPRPGSSWGERGDPGAIVAGGGGSGGSAHNSVLDRMARLERRLEGVASASARAEDGAAAAGARAREGEARADAAHAALKGDLRQALALASAASRAEAEAEASSRVKEAEKRLTGRMQAVEEHLDNKVTAVSTRVGAHLSGELDKRFQGLYGHVEFQVNQVKAESDRLQREKVDSSALELYTGKVSGLFEAVAASLGEDMRQLSAATGDQMAALQRELVVLGVSKADGSSVQSLEEAMAREDEAMRMLAGQVRDMMGRIQEALSSQPKAIDELRGALSAAVARTQDDMENVQRSLSSLNAAVSSSGQATEAHSQKLSGLSHRASSTASELSSLRVTLFGVLAPTHGSGGGSGGNNGGGGDKPEASRVEGSSVLGRVAALERQMGEAVAEVASKVSEPALHELERRLAVVARASEGAGESVRSLTSTTFKRVDEHAAAIQRLTLAMSTNIEDRPTTAAVRNMIESAGSARSEAAAGALLPLWDSVKVLQAGVKDAQAEAKAASRTAEACARETAEGRQRGASDRAGVSALVRRTLEEELGGPGGGGMWGSLPPRVAALEEAAHSTKAQLEVHAQLADRHSALLSAVQEQVGSQLAGARAAAAALRSELAGKVDSVASSLSGRTDLLESSTKALSRDVGVLREGLAARPVGPEVKAMVESGAADAARAAVGKHKEKEDMRWQVWLGQFADTLDRLVSRPDLNVALAATNKQAVRDSTLALEPRLRDIASQLEGARGGAERALRETEARLVAQLSAAGCEWADESKRAGDEARALAAALGAKADAAGVESRLRRLESDVSRRVARPELESELAKKLDVRAFLASSASTSAAAAAGAGPAGAAAAAGGARGGGGAQQQQQQQWGASPGVSPGRPPSFAPGRPAAAAAAPPPSASSAGMYAGVAQHPQHPQHLQHQQHLQQQQAQHHGSPAKLTGTVWLTPVDHPHPPEAHAMATVHAVLGGGAGGRDEDAAFSASMAAAEQLALRLRARKAASESQRAAPQQQQQ